jgi:hypothetical protein
MKKRLSGGKRVFLITTTAPISSAVSVSIPSGLDQSVTASDTSPPESGVLQHDVFLIHAAPDVLKMNVPFLFFPLGVLTTSLDSLKAQRTKETQFRSWSCTLSASREGK